MKFSEPKNAELYYNLSRLFARYSGRKIKILTKTLQMLDVALQLQPENADYMTEIGT